jgi:hypothetical protein
VTGEPTSERFQVVLPEQAARTVAEMRAERDRLRAEIEIQTNAADAAAEAVGSMAEKLTALLRENARLREAIDAERPARLAQLKALTAERDRLRAVVEAARAYRNAVDITERPPGVTREQYAATGDQLLRVLGQALDQLDVSGVTGLGAEPEVPDRTDAWQEYLRGDAERAVVADAALDGKIGTYEVSAVAGDQGDEEAPADYDPGRPTDDVLERAEMFGPRPSFVCPVCSWTTNYSRDDVEAGWCARCDARTGSLAPGSDE